MANRAIINSWSAYGVVLEEPTLMSLKDDVVCAKTILAVEGGTYLPLTAFNKKAHVLCALVHRGATILAKGYVQSKVTITSNQGKMLVGTTFKVTDFVVMKKEPVAVDEANFADVVQLYEPSSYMQMEEEENAK